MMSMIKKLYLPDIILDKTKFTGCPFKLIQPHDNPLHLTALPKQLVDLLLCGVVAHVPHVQSGGVVEQPLMVPPGPLEVLVPITAQI